MAIEQIWRRYQDGGYAAAAAAAAADDPREAFYLALLAFEQQQLDQAAEQAARAARLEPGSRVFAAAARQLEQVARAGRHQVYISPEGFTAFIRGGGNIPLYQATSAALRAIYQQYDALSLLDIGVGDGMALIPALADSIRQIDLLEPSAALLGQAAAALAARGVAHRAFQTTLQDFAATADGRWDIGQSTFSLQSIAAAERPPLLRWLREHCARLLVVEFDTPALGERCAPERAAHIIARYEQGLAEYPDDDGTVAQGFLMPMLLSAFDPTADRANEEQPLSAWAAQLRAAGYAEVSQTPLYPYWWGTAYLLDARG